MECKHEKIIDLDKLKKEFEDLKFRQKFEVFRLLEKYNVKNYFGNYFGDIDSDEDKFFLKYDSDDYLIIPRKSKIYDELANKIIDSQKREELKKLLKDKLFPACVDKVYTMYVANPKLKIGSPDFKEED